MMGFYMDQAKCPEGHTFSIARRRTSTGKSVNTWCQRCQKSYKLKAGVSADDAPTRRDGTPVRESQIEARLVKRVKELGGEVRKVTWVGRSGAPDRIVMLPGWEHPMWRENDIPARTIWVELKAPGRAATFPKGAHEKAQHREHERMRKMGQRVEVVDSFERIEEILK